MQLVNGPFCGCFCIYIVLVKILAMGTTKILLLSCDFNTVL